ncbi:MULTISPECIES: YcnI family protein [unclassified Arthrobacter]|uniref:YcnI family copper-binding membrane protein n=1 Tax=unclassified Arthrobacter TaxID=235627 RepID=UPI001E2C886D|nr:MULTISPECIES: YcnI family protein [unclassified Arthrobacter]MCC9146736.1 YcnI family protein [Arthrobacter sp. zg-Y919]MDK1277967.1 YcnI family protein [Arthrobacter sp. zg.Y919]WIB03440.1 YcnI family protein [Arthrobacter sp. zg-Y919]
MRNSSSILLAAGGTAALMALGLAPAAAHVHVTPDTTGAGETALLTFDLSHGCEGSPTTALTFTLPDALVDATPTAHAGWEIKKVTEELAEPQTLPNGSQVSSRTSEIVYTAKEPLADGVRDTIALSVVLPDAEDTTLAFPVRQTCAEGETDWSQIPAEGQSGHDLDSPAPAVTITEADDDGHGDGAGHGSAAGASQERASDRQDDNDSEAAEIAGYVGLGAGLLGLAAGVTALIRTRGRSKA